MKNTPPKKTYTLTHVILAFVVGALVMLLANVLYGLSLDSTSTTTPTAPATATQNQPQPTIEQKADPNAQPSVDKEGKTTKDLARRVEGDVTAMGPVDAPLVVIEYADYRCPYCSLFELKTMPILKSEYVDTGKVRFEFRDMPVFGQDSIDAAIAGRAAGIQGKFWEYRDVVSQVGVSEGGHPEMSRDRLIEFARQAGVPDIERFTKDLDDPKLKQAVTYDLAEGQQLGLQSVPAFIIGDRGLLGAQDVQVFRDAIDTELAARGVK